MEQLSNYFCKSNNQETNIYELLRASFQGIKRLFILAYAIATNAGNNEAGIKDNNKYFLPKGKIENYNVLIDGRSFYDQPINDSIKQYNEVRKVSTGQGDDYTTGCLLLMLISDADPRAIQQTAFQGVVVRADNTKIRLCTILEK